MLVLVLVLVLVMMLMLVLMLVLMFLLVLVAPSVYTSTFHIMVPSPMARQSSVGLKHWKILVSQEDLGVVEDQKRKPRTGRPWKINGRAARKLVRTVVQRPQTTREELKNDLKASGIEASKHTISRALYREGLRSCTPCRTLLLQKRHVRAKLKYANDHLNKQQRFGTQYCDQMKSKSNYFAETA
ncbi:Transposase Tc1-like [Trinorchestia longiramus]|nr:Transposase Tc1-like [Trinorchestia longiramus]